MLILAGRLRDKDTIFDLEYIFTKLINKCIKIK